MNERNSTVEVTCPECDRKVQLRGVVPYVTNTATKCNRGFWGCDVASCPALRGAVAAALSSRPLRTPGHKTDRVVTIRLVVPTYALAAIVMAMVHKPKPGELDLPAVAVH
jgi:hypothetical protein